MNVLSLFDGMSCGKIALDRATIPVENYYAAEIDKWAIKVTMANFPNTIQLGDANNWRNWQLPKIDLLIAGSPCQGFSCAGKGLNFDDPRSRLFFVFLEILKELKPKFWLLENVKMKKEWQNKISDLLGVQPVEINSALVSAQNRKRLYWANFPISIPKDREIKLSDIIEDGVVDREKSFCIDGNYNKGGSIINYQKKRRSNNLSSALHQSEKRLMVQSAAMRKQWMKSGLENCLNIRNDEKSMAVVSSFPDRLNGINENDSNEGIVYRMLTPVECERLQTVPDNYTAHVSNSQRYKMLGNGWTVDVIAHIFKCLMNSIHGTLDPNPSPMLPFPKYKQIPKSLPTLK